MTPWRRRLDRLPARALAGGLVLHVADRPSSRLRGLAWLQDIPEDRGLMLTRTRSVHTLGMRFVLDLLWLNEAGDVVRIDRGIAPRRHAACRGARDVVEVRAGSADRFAAALGTGLLSGTARTL